VRRVTRLRLADSHWPEFAVTAMSVSSSPPERHGRACPGHPRGAPAIIIADNELPARPIRLLQKPEPIEAVASMPDGPPVRFRWRRVLHEVAAIEGPERIASEWWRHQALTRDYFRAEDSEGRRFWLFREGLYETETMRPRWFMHGLFA
jgi:protein ImuB